MYDVLLLCRLSYNIAECVAAVQSVSLKCKGVAAEQDVLLQSRVCPAVQGVDAV
jgi:hypothetical protein